MWRQKYRVYEVSLRYVYFLLAKRTKTLNPYRQTTTTTNNPAIRILIHPLSRMLHPSGLCSPLSIRSVQSAIPEAAISHTQPGRTRLFWHLNLLRGHGIVFDAIPPVVAPRLVLPARGGEGVVRGLEPRGQWRTFVVFVVEAVGGSRPAGFRPVWKSSSGLLEGRAGGRATHFEILMTRLAFLDG